MITIQLGHFNRATEVEIAMAKSGLSRKSAEKIADIVREMRKVGGNNHRPTIRATIAIAKVTAHCGVKIISSDKHFRQICRDVLDMDTANVTRDGQPSMVSSVDEILTKVLGKSRRARPAKVQKKL